MANQFEAVTHVRTIRGTYGSAKTPCNIFVYSRMGEYWYVVEGSVNVNATTQLLEHGVDVEAVYDYDTMTASEPINNERELKYFIES